MDWILKLPIWQLVRRAGYVRRRDIHVGDRLFYGALRTIAWCVVLVMLGMVVFLTYMSYPILQKQGAGFFFNSSWNPGFDEFGALSFIYGTLVSSLIALLLSAPMSVGAALFLTELAPPKIAKILGLLVEMLAAIPSVVYGLWGIFVLAPFIREYIQAVLGKYLGFIPLFQGPPFGVGMLTASVILAIMITPTICAVCREVFRTVPLSIKEAALGLGATRWEMLQLAILKTSWSGVLGAIILGLGRAMGETMAVTMVIGNRAQISASLFAPAQSMASVIANEYAEASSDLHISALAAVGLALFIVSLVINALARLIIWRVEKRARGHR